jgi:hypothetical protein
MSKRSRVRMATEEDLLRDFGGPGFFFGTPVRPTTNTNRGTTMSYPPTTPYQAQHTGHASKRRGAKTHEIDMSDSVAICGNPQSQPITDEGLAIVDCLVCIHVHAARQLRAKP